MEERYIALLSKGLSFSPVEQMDHFEVYKDLCHFLRRVYFKLIFLGREKLDQKDEVDKIQDKDALDHLVSLFEEGGELSEEEEIIATNPWKRKSNLKIISMSMPQFRKINVFSC